MSDHAEAALPAAPGAACPSQPAAPAPVWPATCSHVLRLQSERALCEATAVRLLARWGLAVQRRRWVTGAAPGTMPALLLLTAPAPAPLALGAARQLQATTGAAVQCSAVAGVSAPFEGFGG